MTYDPTKPLYLRIGDWHSSGRSRNYATGETEAGVSVYDLGPEGVVVCPPDGEWAMDDLMDRLRQDGARHLVQGAWIGTGGDGEPLLRNPVIVGTWPRDLPHGFTPSLPEVRTESTVTIDQASRLRPDEPATHGTWSP